MPSPVMQGPVSFGLIAALPMVERPSFDDQVAAISEPTQDRIDCGFAELVPKVTDKDDSDELVQVWMTPSLSTPTALGLPPAILPAFQPPKDERIEAGSPALKPLLVTGDETVLPDGIPTQGPALSDLPFEFVEEDISRLAERIQPAAIKTREPFPAVPQAESVSAWEAALEPLGLGSDLGGPDLAHGSDKGPAILAVLPAPLPSFLPDPAQHEGAVFSDPAGAMRKVLAPVTDSHSISSDLAGAMPTIDFLIGPLHEIELPTALMLRFESEGRSILVRPLVRADIKTTVERHSIQRFRPETALSVPLADLTNPDLKAIDNPPRAESSGPVITSTTLATAEWRLPKAFSPVAKDEDNDRNATLTQTPFHSGLPARVGGPFLPAESQKIAVPVLSPLLAPVMDAVVTGSDGETTLTLSPEELGKVQLSFRPDKQYADTMVVMLGFDRPETMELFRRHADQLADALRSAGYAGIQIGFGGKGDGNSRQPFDWGPPIGGEGDDRASADAAVTVPAPRRNETLGGLDLRL